MKQQIPIPISAILICCGEGPKPSKCGEDSTTPMLLRLLTIQVDFDTIVLLHTTSVLENVVEQK